MSGSASLNEFRKGLVNGWLYGVQFQHYHNIKHINSAVSISRANGGHAGNIDALLLLNEGVPLGSLLPDRRNIRPLSISQANPIVTGFFAAVEMPLSTDDRLEEQIERFVRFYTELLSLDGLKLSSRMKGHIHRCSHLCFVFHGVDAVAVETTMRNALRSKAGSDTFQIGGRPVVLVWADEVGLCCWGDDLRVQQQMAEQRQKLAEQDRYLAELDRYLAALDRRIAEQDRQIAKQNRQFAKQDRQINLRTSSRLESRKRVAQTAAAAKQEDRCHTSSHARKRSKRSKPKG